MATATATGMEAYPPRNAPTGFLTAGEALAPFLKLWVLEKLALVLLLRLAARKRGRDMRRVIILVADSRYC